MGNFQVLHDTARTSNLNRKFSIKNITFAMIPISLFFLMFFKNFVLDSYENFVITY